MLGRKLVGYEGETGLCRVLYAELAHCESCLVDTSGFGTRAKHICLVWYIVARCYSSDLVEEAMPCQQIATALSERENSLWRRVHQVELARVLHDLWYTWIVPNG